MVRPVRVRGKVRSVGTTGRAIYVRNQRWRAHFVPEHAPIRKRSRDRVNFTRTERLLWFRRGRTKFTRF